jgi:hypothetical protein
MDFTDEEIKVALFSILDDKTPKPNGFTYLFFFFKSWAIIRVDLIAAIQYFFDYYTFPYLLY